MMANVGIVLPGTTTYDRATWSCITTRYVVLPIGYWLPVHASRTA
jgi:hypothetical protein